jgi:hypothetical protein
LIKVGTSPRDYDKFGALSARVDRLERDNTRLVAMAILGPILAACVAICLPVAKSAPAPVTAAKPLVSQAVRPGRSAEPRDAASTMRGETLTAEAAFSRE